MLAETKSQAARLRILVIADSKITVPPTGYGGAERILARICDGLMQRGHHVTLMGAEGSETYNQLITYPWAGQRNLLRRGYAKLAFFAHAIPQIFAKHDAIIAGCRTDYLKPFLYAGVPLLYRFGNPIDARDVGRLTSQARGPLSLIAVSEHQRQNFTEKLWTTIYNSVDVRQIPFNAEPGRHLAFIGRLTANKGVDTAMRVARSTGLPLKIAGNVSDEAGDREFFKQQIEPYLDETIEWIGEIGDDKKYEFLGNALALLAPIRWDEPCANVVMEALACGTPVVTTRRGSMPELVKHAVTGFLAASELELTHAVGRVHELSRDACRREAENRFSSADMVEKYLNVVRELIARKTEPARASVLNRDEQRALPECVANAASTKE
jgi:glycosyltransferase involved in cell wall biosynthesis